MTSNFTHLNILSNGAFSALPKHPLFDIKPTKTDAETFSIEHKSDENKTISELHLCMGGNTRGFSHLKLNLFVITLAFLPRETDTKFC